MKPCTGLTPKPAVHQSSAPLVPACTRAQTCEKRCGHVVTSHDVSEAEESLSQQQQPQRAAGCWFRAAVCCCESYKL